MLTLSAVRDRVRRRQSQQRVVEKGSEAAREVGRKWWIEQLDV